jgi:hypothetical protein
MSADDEGRALADAPLSAADPDDDSTLPPRCRCCGRLLYARESVRLGVGRDCRRRFTAGIADQVPDLPSSLGGAA